jgi:type III secretory pathway component EscV
MCEVCGPVMLKIKQQERDDGTNEDPLTRDQEMVPMEQRSTFVASVPSSTQHVGEQSQLHMVQAVQTKLKAQLDILKLLQKHQEQLLEQQKKLESQAQNISDPNSPEFLQLQEQQVLLQQLQKRFSCLQVAPILKQANKQYHAQITSLISPRRLT